MSATVTAPSRAKAQAWCAACQDGVNGSARRANDWAKTHNLNHHGGTE